MKRSENLVVTERELLPRYPQAINQTIHIHKQRKEIPLYDKHKMTPHTSPFPLGVGQTGLAQDATLGAKTAGPPELHKIIEKVNEIQRLAERSTRNKNLVERLALKAGKAVSFAQKEYLEIKNKRLEPGSGNGSSSGGGDDEELVSTFGDCFEELFE
ncbi:hypothetical protein K435DRAFT_427002 [Dendrothele bispora CBS 962.96]|uniref:Uncharacterized protein n=1 Tax=Dendrothele bispora (strain CBS 962.96) TaxID=1314807 RepID=A0A4S8L4F6_DENBC|nr:hypothetical protein K435DRAFT_427002 [Dendrothele bispora CBS 962.96]